jgi:hypothetical protein
MRAPEAAFPTGNSPTLVDRVPKHARRRSVGARGLSKPGGVAVIRWWAGFASLGAGIIHLAVASEHASEWWLYGVFFLVLGMVQIGWAVLAMEGDSLPVPLLFAWVNAAIVGVWLVSRTSGLPVGPEPWGAEAVGVADFLCTALEAVVTVLLVYTLRRPQVQAPATLTKAQRRMVAIGAVVATAVTVAALVANPPVFGHYGHGHHSHDADAAEVTGPPAHS